MLHKLSFRKERHISFVSSLERKFTGECNQISRNSCVYLASSFIEGRTFNKMHINMVRFDFKTYQPLDYLLIVYYRQFVNIPFRLFIFKFPIKLPFVFFSYFFQVNKCYNRNIGCKTVAVTTFSIELVSLSISKSSPVSFCFFTPRIYEICVCLAS